MERKQQTPKRACVTFDEYMVKLDAYRAKTFPTEDDVKDLDDAFHSLSFWSRRKVWQILTEESRESLRHKPRPQDPDFPPTYNPPDHNFLAAEAKDDLAHLIYSWSFWLPLVSFALFLLGLAERQLNNDPTLHPTWPRDPIYAQNSFILCLIFFGTYLVLDHYHDKEIKEAAQLRQQIPLVLFEHVFEPRLRD